MKMKRVLSSEDLFCPGINTSIEEFSRGGLRPIYSSLSKESAIASDLVSSPHQPLLVRTDGLRLVDSEPDPLSQQFPGRPTTMNNAT